MGAGVVPWLLVWGREGEGGKMGGEKLRLNFGCPVFFLVDRRVGS